ncbi:hypothetical protein B0J13DRAFT_523284 [Dactylonectria estremocensis]|uniref:Uncharacterized protein n=1 Tax=Dactylonectria estremocensis TaxID=1079267 RepID=A0A9P9F1N4_9HYPO|nr:hypothetical protein B0J13DRAFT_523284 [Dactylonectria estremocensis]
MTATENPIQGIPQSIQNGAVLLGLSSWHLYPNMLVLKKGPITIDQGDQLVHDGGIRNFEYATAIPAQRDAYKRTVDDTCNLSEGHTRWVTTLVPRDEGYIFDSLRSESMEKLGEDTFPIEEEIIKGQDDYFFRWVRYPNLFMPITKLKVTDFAEVDLDAWEEGTETFAKRVDFQFVSGDVHSCALFTAGSRPNTNHKSQTNMLVPHDVFRKAL